METSELTKNNVKELIGKRIQWFSPCYKGNKGYYGYGQCGGICTINEVDFSNRNPIISNINHEGDDIKYAFIEEYSYIPFTFCYGDSDREIMFKILENEN